jgi:hypothetical protein
VKILVKLLNIISKLLKYIRFKKKRELVSKTKEKVLISIFSIKLNRKFFQLVYQFLNCGYDCYLNISLLQFIKGSNYGLCTIMLNGVYPVKSLKQSVVNYSIIVSDSKKYLESFKTERAKKILVNFYLFKNIKSITQDDFFYPILSHRKYLSCLIETEVLSRAFKYKRKIGVIFAGNADTNYYNLDITKELFKINTRSEMFCYLLNSLPEKILYIPKCLETFKDDIENGLLINRVVLLNTKNFSIPQDMYFDILLNSNFYIYMCGFIQPFCHNQIESMMAGCVPITQFASFFVPPFQHEINGLLFNTMDELLEILLTIVSEKYKDRILYMRENILYYFERYYSLQSFKNKLSSLQNNSKNDYSNYYTAISDIKFLS